MRLSKELIRRIAEAMTDALESKGLASFVASKQEAAQAVAAVITDDLAAEDRLNAEVEKVLSAYESEIKQGQMDYRKVFELTKQKLARERGIVL